MVAFLASEPSRFSVLHRRPKVDLAPSVLTVNETRDRARGGGLPIGAGYGIAAPTHRCSKVLLRALNEGRRSPIELVAASHAANMHEGARLEALYSVKK
jgi:hypothetical protein